MKSMQQTSDASNRFHFYSALSMIVVIFIADWISTINLSTAALYVIPLHIAIFKIENRSMVYCLLSLTLVLLGIGCFFSHSHDIYIGLVNHIIVAIVVIACFLMSLKFKTSADELVWMKQLVNESTDYVAQTDRNGKILLCNQALKNLTQFEQLNGKSFQVIHSENEASRLAYKVIPSAIEHGTWSGETQIKDRKGASHLTSMVLIVHKSHKGIPLRFSWIHRGISEQRKLEQRERLLLEILNKSSDFIYQIDTNKNIIFLNKALKMQLGIGEAPTPLLEQLHPDKDLALINNIIIPRLLRHGTWKAILAYSQIP